MNSQENSPIDQGITEISVQGFKSLYEESRIEIRPLTILAGANSSGKSSIMQPLLLMKQTLEAVYDPGTLLINGPNVKFTFNEQLFSKTNNGQKKTDFSIAIKIKREHIIKIIFLKNVSQSSIFTINQFTSNINTYIYQNIKQETILKAILKSFKTYLETCYTNQELGRGTVEDLVNKLDVEDKEKFLEKAIEKLQNMYGDFIIVRNKCFLYLRQSDKIRSYDNMTITDTPSTHYTRKFINDIGFFSNSIVETTKKEIIQFIHIPGLRGSPERSYPISAINNQFPGTFDNYFASIIYNWQVTQDPKIEELNKYLQNLGLTSKVTASRPNDVSIELQVGLSKEISDIFVNIADVGFGVSQVLPVLVALLVAEPGQLVYLEQPELHLHPRAQANLAQPLIDAANRGVKVVVETHNDLLLTRIKTLVAEEIIDPTKLILHWFSRGDDGITKIDSKELDKVGAYGEFPIDFSDVFFEEDHRYIDAASKQLLAKNKK